jgi:hypothetical protein
MWYKTRWEEGTLPGWIMVVILIWILASLLLGATMILFLRRRESAVPPSERGAPRLLRRVAVPPRTVSRVRAACDTLARRRRTPRAGA